MKFHCPNCEARYRIADEKLASRPTARMKCRACGFLIDIRQCASDGDDANAVTVATLAPPAPPRPDAAPIPALPVPPAVPGGGLLGQDVDTVKLAGAVAVSPGTFGALPSVPSGAGPVAYSVGVPPAAAEPQVSEPEGDTAGSASPPVVLASLPEEKAPDSMPMSRGFMELQEAAGIKPSRALSPLAWVLVILAYGFGLGTGVLLFGTERDGEPIAVAPAPEAPAPEPAPAAEPPAPEPEPEEESGLAALSGHAASKTGGTGRPRGTSPASGEPAPAPTGRGLLTGLQPGQQNGPSAGPGAGESATGGGGQLSSADIQKTVSAQQPGVRRACWERALNSRDLGAPSSARVSLSITVAPSGQVTRVSSTGDPAGYPNLATCIENRVRSWTFPRSGEQTTVNVPFVFTAQ
jgi:predicted Zn finger-like uncharacterized protein